MTDIAAYQLANHAAQSGSGVLLTRQWRDTAQGIQLVFWLATENGSRQLVINAERAVCFVPQVFDDQIKKSLKDISGSECRALPMQDFLGRPVSACYFSRREDLRKTVEQWRAQGIDVYEDDILPHDRFLMERFVFGSLRYRAVQNSKSYEIKAEAVSLPLKMVSFDIETSMDGKELFSIAVYARWQENFFTQVFMCATEASDDYRACLNGAEVLKAFLAWVKQFDPDILIGWNVINFDLRQLELFGKRFNVPIVLGRDKSRLHLRAMDDDGQRFQAHIAGRVVLDGIDLLKTAMYRFESFSLDSVSQQILGEGKLLHGNQRGEDIARLFVEDKSQLAKYNLQDCKLVWDIFEKLRLLEFAIARTELTGLPLDRIGGSVASFDYRYLPLLHREGFVGPNGHRVEDIQHSPGGLVLNSRPGLYDQVLVFDFKSLYPSIIRSFLIDPLGLALADLAIVPPKKTIGGFNGGRFAREKHLLPEIITNLWAERDAAKREKNAALSQAIKILMNSFYGVLGSPGCRFFDPRLASSITRRGQQIITDTVTYIEQRGFQVIYGDTDSVFVWLESVADDTAARDIGKNLQQAINQYWRERLQKQWQLESALEIQFERHFRRFLMPTIRGSELGSKKRYAGLAINESGAEELVFRGLEVVRTDWTPLARRMQQELYRRIFAGESYRDYLRELVADLRAGRCDDELVYRKRLRQSLSDYQRNIPPHAQAAIYGASLGVKYRAGDWVEYVMTTSGAQPVTLPLTAPLDYEHYLERQLAPPVDAILQFTGSGETLAAIVDEQLSLL